MAHIVELGSRIELVSMDKHFHDISLGLYQQAAEDGSAEYIVHSYADIKGVDERIRFVMRAMQVLGGMEVLANGGLRFACGDSHVTACRRLFLEASKVAPDVMPEVRPMTVYDKKTEYEYSLTLCGNGLYRVAAQAQLDEFARRVNVIAAGLRKLGNMAETKNEDEVLFSCGAAHDALIGMLLVRAPNVRAVMREEDSAARQGVLAAPSSQSV
ncbi:MAG: hypothetical protein CMM54_06535 [Rhodospirillaceae bacterium]|nr:hypothetical protein [Rhodospirillaceae bacterium]